MAAESYSSSGFYTSNSFSLHQSLINSGPSEMISEGVGVSSSSYFSSSGGGVDSNMILDSGASSSNVIGNDPGSVRVATCRTTVPMVDFVPGIKHDFGFAVEWTAEEQRRLEEGLVKFADEPSIMRYIKIAATLRDKTVRDVALRCRWMTDTSANPLQRKRRKPEEQAAGKKVNSRKDKLVESTSETNVTSGLPMNMAHFPLMMQQFDHSEHKLYEGINGTAKHLLEQNAQALSQISANLSTYKQLQDNIELFCQMRSNLNAILNDMMETPGIMSQMPPLPVSINEDLASSILPIIPRVSSERNH